MAITRTVNADRRYYLDEDLLENPESFLDTLFTFNDIKIDLYNHLYDQKFLNKGILTGENPMTACGYVKQTYGTNDYYNAAVYKAASAQVSSQKELHDLYIKTVSGDIEVRQKKLASVKEELDKKLSIKRSIRTYIKEGRWVKPYPKCTLVVHGKRILGFGIKETPLDQYEYTLDRKIRELKNKLSMLTSGLKRKQQCLERLKELPPKRVIFGTRKLYAAKDAPVEANGSEKPETSAVSEGSSEPSGSAKTGKVSTSWKQEFYLARHASMSLPGRHTSKFGNFLCQYRDGNLYVTCMDGTETIFWDFHPARYQDEFRENFQRSPKTRQSVCYSFVLKRDRAGRFYIIPSVILNMDIQEDLYLDAGCVGMDINWDHLALSVIDQDGRRAGGKIIPLCPEGKTSGQVTEMVGRVVKEVFQYCLEHQKPLIMEDIDLTMKRHTAKYGSHVGNRHVSLVTYAKIKSCVENQSLRTGIPFRMTDPAYTSQAGKMLFMRKYGISIHSAASYVIGLRGLGKEEQLMPDLRLLSLIPKPKPKTVTSRDGQTYVIQSDRFKHVWAAMTKAFKKVPTHRFYGDFPYDILQSAKRQSLKVVAAAMTG